VNARTVPTNAPTAPEPEHCSSSASATEAGSRWSELVSIMRGALTDEQRAEFDRHVAERREERERAVARAAARGWELGRSALGRDLAAAKAAKKAGRPRPAPTPPPEFVQLGREVEATLASPATSSPATSSACSCACSCSRPSSSHTPAAAPRSSPPPKRIRAQPDGAVRLARVSVPGTMRERCIVQLPIDDGHDRAGNSLVYGFGLRTLMGIGAVQRRHALVSIVRGYVNPHDPIDVVRWGLSRRLPESERKAGTLATLDSLAIASRTTRAIVGRLGIDRVRAEHLDARGWAFELPDEGLDTSTAPSSDWSGVGAAIDTLAQLVEHDRAQLAGLLASGDLDIARAWAQQNLMDGER